MNKAGHCWRCEAACTQRCSRCRVAFYCSKECQIKDKWRHKPDCDAAALKTQCSSCGREQEGMMKCSNCLEVFYCSTECQRNDWVQHKSSCQESVDKTLELVEEMKELFENEEKNPGLAKTYYWGNVPAVDLLNISMNEGDEYSDPLALLLCGVGDPRNVLLTIASLPDVYKQKVTFVLNDICQCTLARTILLLYMINKGGDDVAGTVVRVWYSVCILEQDFAFLTSALQDLVTASELRTLTGGLMEVSADQLRQLKSVWTTWIRLSRRKGPWVKELRQAATSYFDSEWEDTVREYMHGIPKEHRASTLQFFHTGIFYSSTNEGELTRQNFTLTGQGVLRFKVSSDFDYSIPPAVLPFTGWDYKAIKKTGCYAASLPKMYTIYLAQIVQKCLEKLSSDQVKFHFILCDVLNVEASLPIDLKYDRVTTSNLWDYCPLTILLTKFKGFLNESNPHAVILTGTISWSHNFMPEIIHVLPFLTELPHRALKDTRNSELAKSSGPFAVVEYVDFTDQFNMFLRASLLTSCTDKELASFRRKKRIPSVKSLVSSLGLHLRDFIRNENTVFPFRWALNCRRVVMLHGYERELEWKLVLVDSAAEEAANK